MIRYNPNINEGLNTKQVQYRIKNGYINKTNNIKNCSIYKSILNNFITIFNLLNLFIAFLFFYNNSYIGIIFIIIVIFNTLIHLINIIKTKTNIDKFNNSNPFVTVIRDSKSIAVNKNDVVLDDIIIYKENSKVIADSKIMDGIILVDESCLNGRVSVLKKANDMLYAGSKVITGRCTCRVDKIGNDNYITKLLNITRNKNSNSYVRNILNVINKYVSIVVLILSIVIYIYTKNTFKVAVYIYKIVPIELGILITLLFIFNIFKLKKEKVLVKKFKSIENIRDIDTICFDKTGTLTTNDYILKDVVLLNQKHDVKDILNGIGKYCDKDNNIINAIYKKYNKKTSYEFNDVEYQNDCIKINFKNHKYILLETNDYDDYKGYRVFLLKESKDDIALLIFSYEINNQSKELISKLYESNMNIKIISGDLKDPVIDTCKKIGINKIKTIDMSVNITNMNRQIVEEYNVFYNVSAEQEKILINALKDNNHNILMIGDGINDILGLNAADSSICIYNDIVECAYVTDYVIFDNNIKAILDIINRSKLIINNIFKIMYLYLYKIIYSFLISITFFILNIYSFKFDIEYMLIFLIPSLIIVFNKNDIKMIPKDIINNSILVSLITYILTIIILLLNLNNVLTMKLILLLVSLMEFITLLKFNLINKFISILLIIIAFSCIII